MQVKTAPAAALAGPSKQVSVRHVFCKDATLPGLLLAGFSGLFLKKKRCVISYSMRNGSYSPIHYWMLDWNFSWNTPHFNSNQILICSFLYQQFAIVDSQAAKNLRD